MHDLPIFGTLETMSELGIALFGFSGIVSVIGRGKSLPWTIQDKVWFGGLLNWSFILIVAGFTPSIMREIYSDIYSVFYASNLIFLIVHAASYLWFGFSFFFRPGFMSFRVMERIVVLPSYAIATLILAAQVYVLFFETPYIQAIYIVSAGWFIYCAALAFTFMLFPRTESAA